MRTVKGEGSYTRKATGEEISFVFEFPVIEDGDVVFQILSDVVKAMLSDKKLTVLQILNQTLKEDCRNDASGKAKSVNGDSTARILTAEEKEANKVKAKADRELLKALKAKGVSIADLEKLLG